MKKREELYATTEESRDQVQLMIQSMLEERFQLKAHLETRELPIYHLPAADQTPVGPPAGGPPSPCGPAGALPAAPVPPPPPPPGQRGTAFETMLLCREGL